MVSRLAGQGNGRHGTKELTESVNRHVPSLHLGDGLASDDPVLSGELTRSAAGSDRHANADTHGLVPGEIGSSLGEGGDVVRHGGGLATGEGRHLDVGGRDVPQGEDACLALDLEGGADLDEAVRPTSGR